MGSDRVTQVTAIVGAVTGVAALFVSCFALWVETIRRRVKLRVVPLVAFTRPDGFTLSASEDISKRLQEGLPPRLSIQVTNLSDFAITIAKVGFGARDEGKVLVQSEVSRDRPFPVRLESRESVTLYGAPNSLPSDMRIILPKAYAITDCGHIRYGESTALKQFLEFHAKSAR